MGHYNYNVRTGTINMGCPEHKWVEVESVDLFARYCYKCKLTEEYHDGTWIGSDRKLF